MNLSALKKNLNATATALRPPLDDPVYQSIMNLRRTEVLNAESPDIQAARRLPVHARVIQTHYKPYARARLVAEARTTPGAASRRSKHYLYINVYASVREAREEYDRTASECSARGVAPALLEGGSAVAWPLANAPGLETVRFCFDAGEFRQFLADHELATAGSDSLQLPQLVRYVPRKRALFRCGSEQRFYIKCYEPGRAGQAADNLASLGQSGGLRFNVPLLIARDNRLRALVMSEVPGVPLTTLMDRVPPDIFATVGRALATFHENDLKPAGSWTPERLIAALLKAMADVKLALPGLGDCLQNLLDRIVECRRGLSFDEQAPIHGNLFSDQILVDSARVGIVDWDDLGSGDPLYDLGRLFAHVIYRGCREKTPPTKVADDLNVMMKAYAQQTGRAVARDRLRWHIAVALLMRAKISALRMLPTGWADDVAMAIEAADLVLTGESPWRAP